MKFTEKDALAAERQAAENSLWYYLGGEHYSNGQRTGIGLDLEPRPHGELVEALQSSAWDELLAMMHRGLFKSHIGCGWVSWRVAKNRNTQATLLSSTYEVSEDNIGLIEQMLEDEWVTARFGRFKDPRDWSTQSFTVTGRKGFVRGSTVRYKSRRSFRPGGHNDIFWIDDFEDQDTVENPDTLADGHRILSLIYPMADKPGAQILTTGTYWDRADSHCKKEETLGLLTPEIDHTGRLRMKRVSGVNKVVEYKGEDGSVKNLRVRFLWKPAITVEGEANFPQRLSLAELERLRATMSAATFSAQYRLDPVGGVDAEFPPAFFEDIYQPEPVGPDGKPLPFAVIHGIDASIGRRRDGDRTAIIGVKVYASGRWHIFRVSRVQIHGEQLIKEVVQIGRDFPGGLIAMEEDNYVAGLRISFRDAFLRENVHPRIEWIKAGSRSGKEGRTRSYRGRFAERLVTMARGCEGLEDELLTFPGGDRMDARDALANVHEFATVIEVRKQIDAPVTIKHTRVRKFLEGAKRLQRRAGGPVSTSTR